jgi:hypothetical protein
VGRHVTFFNCIMHWMMKINVLRLQVQNPMKTTINPIKCMTFLTKLYFQYASPPYIDFVAVGEEGQESKGGGEEM